MRRYCHRRVNYLFVGLTKKFSIRAPQMRRQQNFQTIRRRYCDQMPALNCNCVQEPLKMDLCICLKDWTCLRQLEYHVASPMLCMALTLASTIARASSMSLSKTPDGQLSVVP